MQKLSSDYNENIKNLDETLRINESFDVIKKVLKIADGELSFYYIDGLVKDGILSKLMTGFIALKDLNVTAEEFDAKNLPYNETDVTDDVEKMVKSVLSGCTLLVGNGVYEKAIILDLRSYPSRELGEPESDRVMRGAHDGFIETLICNTALIRRRIRDPKLTFKSFSVGRCSATDVVVAYIEGRADEKLTSDIVKKIKNIKTDSLTMGQESLKECLIPNRWYNPFPKAWMTERPDCAAAQLYEGSILVICDNTPQVMILPTSIFDFIQETNDFYFPPLTGTYIRTVRYLVFFLTLFLTPTWFLLVQNPEVVPEWLKFIIPESPGHIPIFLQLILVEFIIDGLRMASMNTPDMLTNSLSVVGALILGDFAVSIGWLIPEVILYMAFVAISNFAQGSYELGYAFKFLRIMLTILIQLFNWWGFAVGTVVIVILIATNTTVMKRHTYLYPLIPFNGKALFSLFIRRKKKDNE